MKRAIGCFTAICCWIAIIQLGSLVCGAAPPSSDKRPAQATASSHRLEALEMLAAVLRGSPMGPGDGWFHAGQSRYGWEWLQRRCHTDQSGAITRSAFPGPSAYFDRLDHNHDGVLTAEDFSAAGSSATTPQARAATQWFQRMDTDSNGRISRAEWDACFDKMARSKGYITPDDLLKTLAPAHAQRTSAPQGPSLSVMLWGLLTGELGSLCEGPNLGDVAPDFTLTTQDGTRRIHLADFRGRKPVVLVFGSFT